MRTAVALAVAVSLFLGCYGGGSPAPDASSCTTELPACPASPPSYKTTVSPILNQACVTCHYTGTTIAKNDFSTYDKVHQDLGAALNQVYACAMPPATSTPLTADQRQTLLEWLVCGAPNN